MDGRGPMESGGGRLEVGWSRSERDLERHCLVAALDLDGHRATRSCRRFSRIVGTGTRLCIECRTRSVQSLNGTGIWLRWRQWGTSRSDICGGCSCSMPACRRCTICTDREERHVSRRELRGSR